METQPGWDAAVVIQLQKCAERPLEIRQAFDLTKHFVDYPEIETIDPVQTQLTIAPAGHERFLVTGSVTAHLTAYCVRCLEPFPLDLDNRFQLTYLPESKRPRLEHGHGMMDRGEVDLSYYQDDQLELLPLIEEQLNLALPMRLLCSEGCRGLCQYCGANKNLTDCRCVEPAFVPWLETLKGVKH